MQEKIQKISPIKQKILYFADTLNISKRKFYEKIGVSRGTLESNTGITEEILAKFIANFPEISLEWLLLGNGEMLKKTSENVINQSIIGNDNVQAGHNSKVDARRYYSDSPDVLRAQIDEKERLLLEKEERIKEKDAQIKEKDAQINKLLSIVSNNQN